MDNQSSRRYMIQNGDVLRDLAPDVVRGFVPKDPLRTLEESQGFIDHAIDKLEERVDKSEATNLLDEIFVSVDYPKTYVAKSYQIASLYDQSKLTVVGTSEWRDEDGEIGRSDIVRGDLASFQTLNVVAQSASTKVVRKEIDRIHGIDLLTPESSLSDCLQNLNHPTESVELAFYNVVSLPELITRLNLILELAIPLTPTDFISIEGTYYVELNVTNQKLNQIRATRFVHPDQIRLLAKFNPLRSMVNVTGRDIYIPSQRRNPLQYLAPKRRLPVVGLVDGGVMIRDNPFFEQVNESFVVSALPSDIAREHGSSVASILMYGELPSGEGPITPEFAVESIRALPSQENQLQQSLIDLDKILEEAIPQLSQIKIWNISIGPKGPVLDEHIGSLTATLDKLAFKYDVLFVIAVGNTGWEQGFAKRLQTPADSVNNFSVTAYSKHRRSHQTAPYASIGPGREGGKMKPDISGHGGIEPDDFVITLSSSEWFLNNQQGTSFAAPFVSRALARVLWQFPELDVLELRAAVTQYLALHFAKDHDIYQDAKGELSDEPEKIVEAEPDEFRIKYSGELTAGTDVLINIALPEAFTGKTVEFTWTTAVKSDVDPSRPDAYTKFGIEDTLYPDADKYVFYNAESRQTKRASVDDEERVQLLLQQGFKARQMPVTGKRSYLTTPYPWEGKNEAARREQLKWDTVKSQKLSMRATAVGPVKLTDEII